ncbi:MAG: hypothetical protein COB36_10635 [Alphaproteobacteria bacterium]|nr:MAG: hypothetical protein COB36_10635 [Alphaproteobacteria bacterium]
MAAGDVVFFQQWLVDVQEALHDGENDDFRYSIVDSTITPLTTTSDPRWGAGGSTDLSVNEVATGGNYTVGGIAIANPSVTLVSGEAVWDGDDFAVTQHASNPTDGRWGIIWNNTATGKQAVGFQDLGSVTDLSAGAFSNTWNAAGISKMSRV